MFSDIAGLPEISGAEAHGALSNVNKPGVAQDTIELKCTCTGDVTWLEGHQMKRRST